MAFWNGSSNTFNLPCGETLITCEEVSSLLGLAVESTEAVDDRFAISVETVGSKKIGRYLTKDQDASKALVHSGRLFLRGLWEILSTR